MDAKQQQPIAAQRCANSSYVINALCVVNGSEECVKQPTDAALSSRAAMHSVALRCLHIPTLQGG
jgi:hypothetical protein